MYLAYHGLCESLALEPVAGEAGLVREPLLVDVLVHAGQDAEDLARPVGDVVKKTSRLTQILSQLTTTGLIIRSGQTSC